MKMFLTLAVGLALGVGAMHLHQNHEIAKKEANLKRALASADADTREFLKCLGIEASQN